MTDDSTDANERREIDVEAVDTEWIDETVEIRLRGERLFLIGLTGALHVGSHAILEHPLAQIDPETSKAAAALSHGVVDYLVEEGFGTDRIIEEIERRQGGVWINTDGLGDEIAVELVNPGDNERVHVDRDVLEELVITAKGEMERMVTVEDFPPDAAVVADLSEAVEAAEEALQSDDSREADDA